MSIEAEKLKIIEWLANLKDDSAIEKIKLIKDNEFQHDWWDEITEEEKLATEKGIEDIKAGMIILHEEVRKSYVKWI